LKNPKEGPQPQDRQNIDYNPQNNLGQPPVIDQNNSGNPNGNGFNLPNSNFNPLYNNLSFGNAALSNYLSTVKGNNSGLYDSMPNPSISDQLIHKGNQDRSNFSEQHQKMLETMNRQPLQNDDQQSILCLVQQISLYK
jgi:hypothetical protein